MVFVSDCYFRRVSEHLFRATAHTAGAWSESEQHIAPLTGLAVHAIERHLAAHDRPGGPPKAISRVSFDILGVVPIEEVELDITVVRPGRSIDLIEAVAQCRGRDVLVARAWRSALGDTGAVSGTSDGSIPGPAEVPLWDMTSVWPGAFIDSLVVRRGADAEPGRSVAWVDTPIPLVADEEVSTLARYVGLVDTANGVAVRRSPREWMFPNLDLQVHLARQPVPGPVGLDVTVTFGPDGQGLTSTILHDVAGPIGRAAQILTVRPLH